MIWLKCHLLSQRTLFDRLANWLCQTKAVMRNINNSCFCLTYISNIKYIPSTTNDWHNNFSVFYALLGVEKLHIAHKRIASDMSKLQFITSFSFVSYLPNNKTTLRLAVYLLLGIESLQCWKTVLFVCIAI